MNGCQSKPSKTVNDGGRSKTSVLGCSEVIFRDAEKCRTSRHCTRKPRSTLKVEAIRSRWSQIVKSQFEESKIK
ncbi:hypothetical protein EVD33_07365 [Bacteroidales bacterium SW292]|nr:hypothetical protein [Bacteroidales bacterium SW292]